MLEAALVTVRTVEQHLGRVYRELDIPSRAGLTAAVMTEPDARRGETGAV